MSTKLEFKDASTENKALIIGGLIIAISGIIFAIINDNTQDEKFAIIIGLQITILGIIISTWGTLHTHLDKMAILKSRHDN